MIYAIPNKSVWSVFQMDVWLQRGINEYGAIH